MLGRLRTKTHDFASGAVPTAKSIETEQRKEHGTDNW